MAIGVIRRLAGLSLALSFTLSPCHLVTLSPCQAQDPPADKTGGKTPDIAPPTANELRDKRVLFMKSALARYTVQVGDRKEPATVGDPCLRWTNPISGSADGILGVYAHNGGRPAAIGQFFLNGGKKWVNEFTIIPESDVTILRSGQLFWSPSEYVCKLTDLPRSPLPAAKAALRLAQMRAIAAEFSVIDSFGATATKQTLRLLPQPVYRYSEKGKILDGAVFIFALGTDPECCLLVEASQDNDSSRYRYAIAPMSIYQLEARYKDTPVWAIERREPVGVRSRVYYAGRYTPEPGEVLPE
jgi:hypothetical protein